MDYNCLACSQSVCDSSQSDRQYADYELIPPVLDGITLVLPNYVGVGDLRRCGRITRVRENFRDVTELRWFDGITPVWQIYADVAELRQCGRITQMSRHYASMGELRWCGKMKPKHSRFKESCNQNYMTNYPAAETSSDFWKPLQIINILLLLLFIVF